VLVDLATAADRQGWRLTLRKLASLAQGTTGACQQKPVVVLMHHPPFVTVIESMDTVGLETAYPLEPIIRRHLNVERILFGHLHRSIITRFAGTDAVTCPSPAHQAALDLLPDRPAMLV
jgi:3',5'-cyclic AMP phosphodiesterase CpdA